jgi:hypothetical protein
MMSGSSQPDSLNATTSVLPLSISRVFLAPAWSSALSIGESHNTATALHVSRFLREAANGGVE